MKKLTAKRFVKEYPDAERNTNCARDFACSACGNRDGFELNVTIRATVDLYDSGTDGPSDQETTWEPDDYCRCTDCNAEGTVKDFTIEGLDDLILQNEEGEDNE